MPVTTPPFLCPDGSNPCGRYGYCAYCPHDGKAKSKERARKEQYCNYPDCQCPFDRGPEFFCLKSLPQDPAEMK
ncbi:hypothetical protein SAMN04487961_1029 [Marinobacter pelagius]|uniref:Uncharacterized protein n=1 Tax=Marinobacter pelagius TaxID=379482 RepID=A0A1I4T7C5_9GAMM|nr:hypothetical protein SAMN04487961_1029 [Marinobacter pelagius]